MSPPGAAVQSSPGRGPAGPCPVYSAILGTAGSTWTHGLERKGGREGGRKEGKEIISEANQFSASLSVLTIDLRKTVRTDRGTVDRTLNTGH